MRRDQDQGDLIEGGGQVDEKARVTTEFQIAVFAGDGIGPEVMDASLAVLENLERRIGGYRLRTGSCGAAPPIIVTPA